METKIYNYKYQKEFKDYLYHDLLEFVFEPFDYFKDVYRLNGIKIFDNERVFCAYNFFKKMYFDGYIEKNGNESLYMGFINNYNYQEKYIIDDIEDKKQENHKISLDSNYRFMGKNHDFFKQQSLITRINDLLNIAGELIPSNNSYIELEANCETAIKILNIVRYNKSLSRQKMFGLETYFIDKSMIETKYNLDGLIDDFAIRVYHMPVINKLVVSPFVILKPILSNDLLRSFSKIIEEAPFLSKIDLNITNKYYGEYNFLILKNIISKYLGMSFFKIFDQENLKWNQDEVKAVLNLQLPDENKTIDDLVKKIMGLKIDTKDIDYKEEMQLKKWLFDSSREINSTLDETKRIKNLNFYKKEIADVITSIDSGWCLIRPIKEEYISDFIIPTECSHNSYKEEMRDFFNEYFNEQAAMYLDNFETTYETRFKSLVELEEKYPLIKELFNEDKINSMADKDFFHNVMDAKLSTYENRIRCHYEKIKK